MIFTSTGSKASKLGGNQLQVHPQPFEIFRGDHEGVWKSCQIGAHSVWDGRGSPWVGRVGMIVGVGFAETMLGGPFVTGI